MKKTTVKYHLDEEEIKEAIQEWLENNHDVEAEVTITFQVEHKQEQPQTPYRGGMSDWIDVTVITATAEEAE